MSSMLPFWGSRGETLQIGIPTSVILRLNETFWCDGPSLSLSVSRFHFRVCLPHRVASPIARAHRHLRDCQARSSPLFHCAAEGENLFEEERITSGRGTILSDGYKRGTEIWRSGVARPPAIAGFEAAAKAASRCGAEGGGAHLCRVGLGIRGPCTLQRPR